MAEEERQSGRTTALLERALEHARAGRDVLFLVAHDPMAHYARLLAEHLAKALIRNDTGKSTAFVGTLRIRVRGAALRELRGKPRTAVVQDHYWKPRSR